MPAIDITRPDIINFLIESYDKTAKLRMRWNTLHQKKLHEAASFHKEEKGYRDVDVIEQSMTGGMPATSRDFVASGYNRRRIPIRDATFVPGVANLRKTHTIESVGLGDRKEDPRLARPDTDTTFDPVMRPVGPEQQKLIYKGLPRYGREAYLKVRNRITPEDKYYFQECGGWEYGWRLKDSYFSRHAPSHGRVFRMTHGSISRTGPQPDPPHYKASDIPGPSKCPE
ncbi:uncharacterized protein LOC126370999 [Pectinophora gossypiella]|uniref:uncharacterized protein LOC126370999 n=1 Tax=Pectinophora gossypiella TaxID=13191 RepID=UPI00214E60B2|nr:uncharacterized protein LOC126370999 [Pectinophora gossypiella]